MKRQDLIKYFLVFICAIIIIVLFWFKYIRERIPREIPFIPLSLIGCLLLLFICMNYSKILYTRLHLKNYTVHISFIFIAKYFQEPWVPIWEYLLEYHFAFFSKYVLKLSTWIQNLKSVDRIFISFEMVPRFVMSILFFIDVFYFHYLNNFYKMIFLGIFLFILGSIKSMFTFILRYNINRINEQAQIVCVGYVLDAETLIKEQVSRSVRDIPLLKYLPAIQPDFYKKELERLNVPKGYGLNLTKFYVEIRNYVNLCVVLCKFIYMLDQQAVRFTYLMVWIDALFFVSWSFILITSLPELSLTSFELAIVEKFEPFSGLYI